MVDSALTERIKDGVYSGEEEYPLRILDRRLCCPYELAEDKSALKILEGGKIAHLELKDIFPGYFKRHILFSYTASSLIVATASGYLFDGPVRVSAWQVDDGQRKYPSEREGIGLLANVDMLHVRGDDSNLTAGFDNALRVHQERLTNANPIHTSIREALAFYEAMQHHVPRY